MGFPFGGLKSLKQSIAATIADLVGQDIVARTIQLTGGTATDVNAAGTIGSTIASGSNAFLVDATGGRLKMSSAGTTDYFTSNGASQIATAGAFQTGGLLSTANDIRPTLHNTMDIGTGALAYRSLYMSGTIDMGDAASLDVGYTDSSGTPGNATIDKISGRSAIALGAATVTITNARVAATSRVFISPRTRDATGLLPAVTTVGAGSFIVTTTANTTAALTFDWFVVNGT